jgi:GTPase KRas protein
MLIGNKNAGPFPKDVLRLILVLVDTYVDMRNCQLTCKSWGALIDESALLERFFDERRLMDFNDWREGVSPSQLTAHLVRRVSFFDVVGQRKCIRVCVFGPAGSGKSALARRFCLNRFGIGDDPAGQDYHKRVVLCGASAIVDVVDLGGSEQLHVVRQHWLRGCEAIVICIDVSRSAKEALVEARHLLGRHHLRSNPDLELGADFDDELMGWPVLLVGTKCDLPRRASGRELVAFAKAYRTGLVVTSAKDDTRVGVAFEECVRYAAATELGKSPKKGKTGCAVM